jgi:hypothetical protein
LKVKYCQKSFLALQQKVTNDINIHKGNKNGQQLTEVLPLGPTEKLAWNKLAFSRALNTTTESDANNTCCLEDEAISTVLYSCSPFL